jgi:hypothetical protein
LFKSFTIIILISLVCSICATAQGSPTGVGKFRIRLIDGTYIEGISGSLSLNEFSLINYDGSTTFITLDKIQFVERKHNCAIKGAIIGSAIGFGCAFVSIMKANELDGNKISQTIGSFIGIGAVVGTCVGLCLPKWDNVSISEISAGISQNGMVGVRLAFRF